MKRTDVEDIKASLLSHMREEGIEYTMISHGVAHEFAEVDPEFATILASYQAAHEAVETWIRHAVSEDERTRAHWKNHPLTRE